MEIWKDIPTFEGKYEVSDLGRVKSLKFKKERILKNGINSHGYCLVDLEGKTFKVHSLVIWAFKEIAPTKTTNDFVIDHFDNMRTNNNLSNLTVIKHRDNLIKGTNPTGVRLLKKTGKFAAVIKYKGNVLHLGTFTTEKEANLRYNQEVKKLYKD